MLDRLSPESAAYHMPAALRVRGPLDVAALGEALRGVVERHEVSRTRLVEREGELVQVIEELAEVPLEVEDLSGLAEEKREREVAERAQSFGRERFELSEASSCGRRCWCSGPRSTCSCS